MYGSQSTYIAAYFGPLIPSENSRTSLFNSVDLPSPRNPETRQAIGALDL